MIDLDNFKNGNDMFGHLEGDRILKDFVLLLKNAVIRDTDVVCR
ncbi:MAG: Two component sensor with CHASE2 and GGDEF domain [Clostridia bacterium 41_269]|nr:MAG: Two component sensor with CHASE2 and GGDEF domain [Clostridia bacterium 41_269]